MTDRSTDFSSKLAQFLSSTSDCSDVQSLCAKAVGEVKEAVPADAAAVIQNGRIESAIGIPERMSPDELVKLPQGRTVRTFDDSETWSLLVVPVQSAPKTSLLVAQGSGEDFSEEQLDFIYGLAWMFAIALRPLRALETERALREKSDRQATENAQLLASLQERQLLLERLTTIQRSISHRAPLQEVLDAITEGACELTGDEISGMRLIDPEDPSQFVLASASGLSDEEMASIRRGHIGEGAGGRAIAERRLVVIDRYFDAPDAIPAFAETRLQAAMAAPVYEHGEVVGSLVVASYQPGRSYSKAEQEALLAFADHASLALSDARSIEAMREAERTKEMFLAVVTHEFKTPLTVIAGALDLLNRQDGLPPPRLIAELVTAACQAVERMSQLIDRLLEGARAELAYQSEPTFLPDVVAEAIEGYEQIRSVVVGEVPGVVLEVDRRAVEEALGILLENAVAHSPAETEIRIGARVEKGDVILTVSNVGALPDDLAPAALFSPFQRGAHAPSTGVGLGLYIASRLADSLGGSIDAESGSGSVRFSLRFPFLERRQPPTDRAPEVLNHSR